MFVVFSFFLFFFFFFKQKTAYEMRISDWSSDVCSSDLVDDSTAGLTRMQLEEVGGAVGCHLDAGSGVSDEQNGRRGEAEQESCEIGRASCRERVCQYV